MVTNKITIKRSKRNPDFLEVSGGGKKMVRTMSVSQAIRIANARTRLLEKKKKRR